MQFILSTCWKFSKVQGVKAYENLVLGAVVSGSGSFWLIQACALDSDQLLACCFTSELSRSQNTGFMLAEEKELTWHKTCHDMVWADLSHQQEPELGQYLVSLIRGTRTGFTVPSDDGCDCFLVLVFVFTPSCLETCTSRSKKAV